MTASQEKGLAPMPESFEIPEDVTYLNCANMSPQLKAVRTAGLDAVRAQALPWELMPADWFSGAETLRALAARILDAPSDSVALVPSVSYGIAIACVAPPVLDEAMQIAALVAAKSPRAVAHIKRLVRGVAEVTPAEGMANERTLFCDLMVRDEALAAMDAWCRGERDIRDLP